MVVIRKKQQPAFLLWIRARPGRVIATSFLLVIMIGTVLLCLPIASRDGQSIGFLQALFTATSATCVTGLVTVDTATHWTVFGQVVIILLIQTGGLGLVTITSFFYTLMHRKATLHTLVVAQEATASFSFSDVLRLVRKIIYITFTIELAGGLILSWRLAQRFGLAAGLGKGFFTAISAFCNAGFDLMGNTPGGPFSSLTTLNDDPIAILTVAFLIILGGLGFVVWTDLIEWPRDHKLNFHSKVVLILTAVFLTFGTLFFYLSEQGNTAPNALGRLPDWQQPLAAFFQATTTRTAGYNSIDQKSLTDSSKLMSILLMFVGAAPGSTGGGIKITTFSVVVATILSDIKGRNTIVLMRHRLSRETFTRAFAIFGLAMGIILVATTALTFIEKSALFTRTFSFLDLLFETTSAFGTVGLSSAGTPSLHSASWAVLIPVMYLGRVGPASFAISLAIQRAAVKEPVYPEGKILVG